MADVKLRIEVNPDAEGQTIGDITNYQGSTATNANVANTSVQADTNGVFESTESIDLYGQNGLSFSDNDFIFADDDCLGNFDDETVAVVEDEENPNEFIWGVVPANGEYSVKLTFSNADSLEKIFVYGDTASNQFPTEAIVDNSTTIYSDDAKWAIYLGTPASTHTIEFTKWNRPNYNACLSNINVMLQYYDVDKTTGLKTITSTTQSITNASEIQYGILANSGSASIIDVDGELGDMVKDGVIPYYDVNCELLINGNKIQHHITSDSDYYEDKILKLNFNNSLSALKDSKFVGMPLTRTTTAFGVLSYIFSTLGYAKENVGLWNKYTLKDDNISIDGELNKVAVNTKSGWWEIVGFPINGLELNKEHIVTLTYSMPAYSALSGYNGIGIQILSSYPNNSDNANALATTYLTTSAASHATSEIRFTPTSSTGNNLYFIVNFGMATDNQTITMDVEGLSLDGKSLSTSNMLSETMLLNNGSFGTVKQHLDSIVVPYPYLDSSSYEGAFNKVCELAQLNLIENDNGEWRFVSSRPRVSIATPVISLPRYLQETLPSDSLFVKNKIQNINYSYDNTSYDWSLLYNEQFVFEEATPDYTTINGYKVKTKYASTHDGYQEVDLYEFIEMDFEGDFLFDDRSMRVKISDNNGETADIWGHTLIKEFNLLSSNDSQFKYFNTFYDFLQQNFNYHSSSNSYTYKMQDSGTILLGFEDCYGIIPVSEKKFKIYGYVHKGLQYPEFPEYRDLTLKNPYSVKLYGYVLNQTQTSNDLSSFDYELRTNELVQSASLVNMLSNNIMNDYRDGLKSTTLRIKLMDLYDTNGNLVKDYSDGDILQIGDIVRIDKDNAGSSAFVYPNGTDIVWKVIGRIFDFSGVPTVTLQLQEAKTVS